MGGAGGETEREMRTEREAVLWVCVLLVVCFVFIFGTESKAFIIGDSEENNIAPYFVAKFDETGYSDAIDYERSPEHDYGRHELLCGEWAAAVFYEGINTELIDPDLPGRKAMWLTDRFAAPG